jgi:glycosyltransferase involved in cell wall biosynthesis
MATEGTTRVSVAMCTYNGERFLLRQLASIALQTRLPDELIVADDGSSDQTTRIAADFAASVPFPVKIFVNERKLGFVANFEHAVRLCEGDFVALSDQDDAWYPTRLERSLQAFAEHPDAGLVFSDADIVDEQDNPTGVRLWANFGFQEAQKQQLLRGDPTALVKNRFVTGATVMFRRQLMESCLPVGAGWLHDEWFAVIAASVGGIVPIDEPLIRYRRHSSQQVGLGRPISFSERNQLHWKELERQIALLEQVRDRLAQLRLSEGGQALYQAYTAHLRFARFRYGLPRNRLGRVWPMAREYHSYATLGSGVRSMARDFALAKNETNLREKS